MRSTMRIANDVRLASILAVGAFTLHQLRYLIASGSSSSAEHAAHDYLTSLMAPIAVLVLAASLATLIRGTEGAAPERAPLGRRIALFAAALFGIYVGQESLEAILTVGHSAPFDSMFAGGAGVAVPLAVAIGAASALLASVLERVEHVIAVVHAKRMLSRPPAIRGRALPARGLSLPAPLAFGLARRPPPPAPA